MNEKIKKTGDDIWKCIYEQANDKEERIKLTKNMIKTIEREDSLSDLLDINDSTKEIKEIKVNFKSTH